MKRFDFIKDADDNGSESITVDHAPKRKLDLFPRIACLLLALGIWIYMVNVNDADVVETITLKVEIKGVEALDDAGMMVYGLSERTVTFTVKGTNRDLKQFTENDYKATVDVGSLTEVKDNNQLTVNIVTPENSSIVVEKMPANLLIFSDKKVTKTISKINVVLGADAEQEFIGNLSVDNIDISGPQKIVDKVSRIDIKIESEVSEGDKIEGFSNVKYFDKDGEQIDVMDAVTIITEDFSVTIETQAAESDLNSETE